MKSSFGGNVNSMLTLNEATTNNAKREQHFPVKRLTNFECDFQWLTLCKVFQDPKQLFAPAIVVFLLEQGWCFFHI